MKLKSYLSIILLSVASIANGAIYTFNNVANGPGDTLYANSANAYSSGNILTVGTFTTGFDVNANLLNQAILLSNYSTLSQVTIGSTSETLGGEGSTTIFPGYTEYAPNNGADILTGNALIGKTLYAFVGNTASLASSTAFSLFVVAPAIFDDTTGESEYVVNPGNGGTVLIGTTSTSTVDAGAGPGTYNTLRTVAIVPEPSSALLGLIGAICLLRRKR